MAPAVGFALTCWAVAAADVLYGPVAIAVLLRHADNAMRGRLMALWTATATATATATLALSSLVGGILVDRLPPGLVAIGAGLLMAIAGATRLALPGRGQLDASVRP